jgi:tRNA (cmo5U34)-methyltransferase
MNDSKSNPSRHAHVKLDHFGEDRARSYDQNNRHLAPILENLHYLIEILLSDLDPRARILCVGAGTGTEMIALGHAFPSFSFVAVDP